MNPASPVRAPGQTFAVTDALQNRGQAASGTSTTRYYLSLDTVKSTSDILLGGTHAVHGMDPGASHTATANVTIPTTTPPGSYFVLACADDKAVVSETNETNNCLASATAAVTVARPDLAETSVTTNPASPVRAPGQTFAVTDALQNRGQAASGTSTTRYYLSLDPVKNAGDVLLTGSRSVPALAANAVNTGTANVTIPPTTALGAYYVLACADDQNTVAETDEANNCVTSAGATVTVTRSDLLETVVSAAPATKQRGTTFPMTDTVQNAGDVASGASSTRYYLSLDAVKSASDILLNGSRSIPALQPGASHSGPVTLTIPANTAPNTYFVLACADAASSVIETNETNNCKAAPATMVVTP
jgi:subtilase family serine protease